MEYKNLWITEKWNSDKPHSERSPFAFPVCDKEEEVCDYLITLKASELEPWREIRGRVLAPCMQGPGLGF